MEELGGAFYIHCIYRNSDLETFYLRMSPDQPGLNSYFYQMYEDGKNRKTYEAVFAGVDYSTLDIFLPTGYQSYAAGQLQQYTTNTNAISQDLSLIHI